MAVKVLDPTVPNAGNPAPTKLQNFATALGILQTVGGLGSAAYGAFNPTPGKTTDMLRTGFSPGAPSSDFNLSGVPSLTNGLGNMADIYKNRPFLGVNSSKPNMVNQN